MMMVLPFLAAFAGVSLVCWIIYALTHPVLAGQGVLIGATKTAGVLAALAAIGVWIFQGFPASLPYFLAAAAFLFCANRLELRWHR
ncbi:chemotaxis protein [Arthrobacter sp. SD76]|uniref:chemotaxis protein n=1 Tax=Arthrobacter sp. SD76 TaxID=3415007 RepID=UPI003C78489A